MKRAAPPGETLAPYLDLFAAQVAVCAQESEEPVATLVQSMLAVSDSAREMLAAARTSRGAQSGQNEVLRAMVERNCVAMLQRVQLSVVAFQFHDLLTQRLEQVRAGLTELGGTLRDPTQQDSPEYWAGVGKRIRDRYSLTEQRGLFDTEHGETPADQASRTDQVRVELF